MGLTWPEAVLRGMWYMLLIYRIHCNQDNALNIRLVPNDPVMRDSLSRVVKLGYLELLAPLKG